MRHATLIALLLGCAVALPAAAMTKEEYRVQRLRIQDKYATDKDRCFTLRPQERDVCEVQAKVDYDTARFDLRARFRPTEGNVRKAAQARADAGYEIERAKCGDLRASAKAICLEEAKSKWTTARTEAVNPALHP